MQIVRDLAGYTLGRSDLLRRAMSKKKGDVMQKERQNFVYGNPDEGVPGCIANGIPEQTANKIYDDMIDFAKYAFNKSHAAAYAVVSYQTAFLKYYYPVEFMAALMTSVIDNPRKVAEYIREVVLSKSGNYMIFFPSYQYMEQVEYAVEDMDFPADLLVQGQGMKEQERLEFLEEFEKPRDHSLAAFCVMGGVFSEGIDLKEERLIGAVIVGTGLPMVCVEQEVLRGYFEEKEEAGFDFAYQYPGMNKVLQAAGRVIRTTEDTGVILLLDERFRNREYRELFPREWEDCRIVQRSSLPEVIHSFWERVDCESGSKAGQQEMKSRYSAERYV